MPLPSPRQGQTQDEFMQTCMSNENMKKEFPQNKQRVAVCMQKWRDKSSKSSTESSKITVEELVSAFLERHPELLKEE
jgi:hypothetical protein